MSEDGGREQHWADAAAEQVLARGVAAPVVATGISPSGQFHVGHLREILTGDALARALRERGAAARLVFIADDLDPLRKVSPFLDPAVYAPLVGQSLCDLPAPQGAKTYANFFLDPFLQALDALRVDVEVLPAHELYAAGKMNDVVLDALDHTREIAKIMKEVTGREVAADWSPWNPRCAACRKITQGRVLKWSRKAATIRSRCGHCGADSDQPIAGAGKLTWRVDWAARWKVLGVTAEPFGKDHASKGGSYDTGARIAREVLEIEPPIPIVYEWIALKGQGDMSSSKGNVLAVDELLEMAPPEVLRYLVLKNRPGRRIVFDPGTPLLRLVDEVDDASASGRDDRALELSRAGGFRPVGVPFHHLVMVTQIAGFDLDRTLALLERGGYGPLDREVVADRMKMARVWLEKHAPEDVKVQVPETLPEVTRNLAPDQKTFLARLAERLPALSDGDAIQNTIRELAAGPDGPGTPRAFAALYTALLGRDRGPRAGAFIAVLGPDKVAARLRQVT